MTKQRKARKAKKDRHEEKHGGRKAHGIFGGQEEYGIAEMSQRGGGSGNGAGPGLGRAAAVWT